MPKDKDKQLLQIRINKTTFREIKEYKDKYYDEFNMSAFFVYVMKRKMEEDVRHGK